MAEKYSASAIVLAAGYSRRMGRDKFSIRMPGGFTMIENIIEKYLAFGCSEMVVVANPDNIVSIEDFVRKFPVGISVVINPEKESNKLKSLIYGCKAITGSLPVFIQPVDNPFIQNTTLEKMCQSLDDWDYAYPVFENKGGHPVLLSKRLVDILLKEAVNEATLRNFLNKFQGKKVEALDKSVLININTPHDLVMVLSGAL